MRFASIFCSSLCIFLFTPSLYAQSTEPNPSSFSVSGDITLTSDYRFRGISNSDNHPTLQGSVSLVHDSGLYAGVWASHIDLGIGTSTEIDYYLGYNRALNEDASLDLSYTYYDYPHAVDEAKADYGEFAAIYAHNNAFITGDTATFSVYYSPKFTADSDQAYYVETAYQYPLAQQFQLLTSIGYTRLTDKENFAQGVGGDGTQQGYYDYKLGIAREFYGFGTELVWVDNNLKTDSDVAKGKTVFSISKSF